VSRLVEARRTVYGSKTSPIASGSTVNTAPSRDPLARLLQAAQIRTGPAGLTLRSTCHSLWIITRDGRRQWYDLAVRDASDENDVVIRTFAW
jgi:hypothetical protein